MDLSDYSLTVSQKHELHLDAVYESHGMGFVPNSDNKEIVLFGSFNSDFKSTLKWLTIVGDFESIEMNNQQTQVFSAFANEEIGNTEFHHFGYTIYRRFLILFGGDMVKDSVHNITDQIFYFDFDLQQWFRSASVKFNI